jgi:hypothetical protein
VTPLHMAAHQGHAEVVKALLEVYTDTYLCARIYIYINNTIYIYIYHC